MILGLQVAVRNRWLEQWLRVRREGFGNKHGFKRSDIHTHSLHNFSSPPRGKWGSHALSLTSTQITEAAISSVDSPPSFPCSICLWWPMDQDCSSPGLKEHHHVKWAYSSSWRESSLPGRAFGHQNWVFKRLIPNNSNYTQFIKEPQIARVSNTNITNCVLSNPV